MSDVPHLLHTVIDTADVRGLAEFYRQLLDLHYRPGDEPPEDPTSDQPDWLVLTSAEGVRTLAFQLAEQLRPTTWPGPEVPMQMHLDLTVADIAALGRQRDRAVALGAVLLRDESDDDTEPLYVFADPAGHPFCIFVSAQSRT